MPKTGFNRLIRRLTNHVIVSAYNRYMNNDFPIKTEEVSYAIIDLVLHSPGKLEELGYKEGTEAPGIREKMRVYEQQKARRLKSAVTHVLQEFNRSGGLSKREVVGGHYYTLSERTYERLKKKKSVSVKNMMQTSKSGVYE